MRSAKWIIHMKGLCIYGDNKENVLKEMLCNMLLQLGFLILEEESE